MFDRADQRLAEAPLREGPGCRTETHRLVRVTTPAPRDIWRALLAQSPEALAFHTPAWLDCLCQTAGYVDASRLYETAAGRHLVLPLVRRPWLPAPLAVASSLPYGWGFGGLVAAGAVTREDAALVLRDLAGRAGLLTSLRPNPVTAGAWASAAPAGVGRLPRLAHVTDLAGGFERVWGERVPNRTRKLARRAERAGITVECDTTGRLVPMFYELYLQSVERWARQSGQSVARARARARRGEPLRKLRRVARRLGEACRVWVAWLDGQPAAASIVLLHGANANDWRAAMNIDLARPTQANYLLLRHSIADACQAGCRYYHLGESGSSESIAFFKSRFGAEPYRYDEYRLERLPFSRLHDRWAGLMQRVGR